MIGRAVGNVRRSPLYLVSAAHTDRIAREVADPLLTRRFRAEYGTTPSERRRRSASDR